MGDPWRHSQVLVHTDSAVTGQVWKTGTCKDKDVLRVVRRLFLFTATRNIIVTMYHIPGKTNVLADFLSRVQVLKFTEAHPSADELPTPLSPEIWGL